MRAHDFKITSVMVIAFVLIFSQGCMRTNFIGEGREDRADKEKGSKAVQPKGLLDEASRIDTRGEVTIEIKFAALTSRGDLAFNVKMDSYSVKLGQYPLDKMSALSNDKGIRVQASKWEISLLIDRQVFGTIYFPSKDTSGHLLLAPGVTNVTLTIEVPIGIPEIAEVELGRSPKWMFQWNVPPGSEGKKAIENIFWANDDGDMHVSFPALWRAIKNNLRQIQYSRE